MIFIRVSALFTGGQYPRHVRASPVARRSPVLRCRLVLTQTHCRAQLFRAAVAAHILLTELAVTTEIGVEIPQVAFFPHLFRFVPAQHSMPNVIRRSNGANLARPIPGQATGVATIEDSEEFGGVRKRAVIAQKV